MSMQAGLQAFSKLRICVQVMHACALMQVFWQIKIVVERLRHSKLMHMLC